VITEYRYDAKLPIELRVPCDIDATHELGRTAWFGIYDKNEGSPSAPLIAMAPLLRHCRCQFRRRSQLGLLPPPRTEFGLSLTRFNRVEGIFNRA